MPGEYPVIPFNQLHSSQSANVILLFSYQGANANILQAEVKDFSPAQQASLK